MKTTVDVVNLLFIVDGGLLFTILLFSTVSILRASYPASFLFCHPILFFFCVSFSFCFIWIAVVVAVAITYQCKDVAVV